MPVSGFKMQRCSTGLEVGVSPAGSLPELFSPQHTEIISMAMSERTPVRTGNTVNSEPGHRTGELRISWSGLWFPKTQEFEFQNLAGGGLGI